MTHWRGLQHWFRQDLRISAPSRSTRTVANRCSNRSSSRKRHAQRAQSRHPPPDRYRQVRCATRFPPCRALIPHRCAVGGHFTAGRADGRPGQRPAQRGIDLLRGDQQSLNMPEQADVLDRGRLGDVGIRSSSGTIAQSAACAGAGAAAKSARGFSTSPLPVEMGPGVSGRITATSPASSPKSRDASPDKTLLDPMPDG